MRVVNSEWERDFDRPTDATPYAGQLYGLLGEPFFLAFHDEDAVRHVGLLLKGLPTETQLIHTGRARSDWTGKLYHESAQDVFALAYKTPHDISDRMRELILSDPAFQGYETFVQGMLDRLRPTKTVVEHLATVDGQPGALQAVRQGLQEHTGRIVWARAAYTAERLGNDVVYGPPTIQVVDALEAARKHAINPGKGEYVGAA